MDLILGTSECRIKEVVDIIMSTAKDKIATEWRTLGSQLEVVQWRLDTWGQDVYMSKVTYTHIIEEILSDWKLRNGSATTLRKFLDYLSQLGWSDTAEHLKIWYNIPRNDSFNNQHLNEVNDSENNSNGVGNHAFEVAIVNQDIQNTVAEIVSSAPNPATNSNTQLPLSKNEKQNSDIVAQKESEIKTRPAVNDESVNENIEFTLGDSIRARFPPNWKTYAFLIALTSVIAYFKFQPRK